ncbi:hypothetical protein EYB26_008521 [Talaromyces marneffei]|uniref:uncharacterized protein n=1 Tax=Talaromyces marneffei TaxID=37727 RepID=UPI0012A9F48D|nr:uncharacterized protein EYB26_008521 [Talaromyces marneffei]QGA20813.1 hypothetical protein EYB26_008521 [Talaromyces marneffei]
MRSEKRSRRGCKQCRAGHHKCDETSPSCRRCQNRGFVCDYGSIPIKWCNVRTVQSSRRQHVSRAVSTEQQSCSASLTAHLSNARDDDQFANHAYNDISPASLLPESPAALPEKRRGSVCLFERPEEVALYTYYVNRVAGELQGHDGFHNPYRKLSVLSLSFPVLLRSILSCAAEHMRSLDLCPAPLAVELHDQAIRAIRLELATWNSHRTTPTSNSGLPISVGMTADESLLAAVLLQPGAIAFSGSAPISVHTHLEIGFHMLTDLGYLRSSETLKSAIPKFLLQRFAIVDLGICVWHRRRPRIPVNTWLVGSANITTKDDAIHDTFDDIQPSFREMAGCPYNVYTFLNRVMHLAADMSCSPSPQSQRVIYQEAITLETEIRTYELRISSPNQNRSPQSVPMDAVRRAFTHAALILLLRRVFLEPSSSPRVQNSVEIIFTLMDNIPVTQKRTSTRAEDVYSGIDSAAGLPFYLAAREALTLEMQQIIREKHEKWREVYPNPARIQLMEVAERLWLQRVKDPSFSEKACEEIETSCDAYIF